MNIESKKAKKKKGMLTKSLAGQLAYPSVV
jgi:hypothetical protein